MKPSQRDAKIFRAIRWLICLTLLIPARPIGAISKRGKHRTGYAALRAQPPLEIDRLLQEMTVEEKVGQLLMVGLAGTQVTPQIRRWVRDRHVGGIALFARNLVNLKQTSTFTRDLRALSHGFVPPLIALDQEGGNVTRLKSGAISLPGNMTLGASRSPILAYAAGHALGVDLWRLGFNTNLAPVLDINSNPANPVIGVRSYGERPDLVGEMGTWFVRGQQETGVCSVAKHFPGHGDTQIDSHYAMPSVNVDRKHLNTFELEPFRRAIAADIDAIMTAHIALPRIAEAADKPATLSRTLLTRILRQELGFEGIIMTDGLEMQGIQQRYGTGRAAVLAILAGADMPMVLWSDEAREETYQALLRAVRRGEISRKRLDQSVRRILTVKQRRGIFDKAPNPSDVAESTPLHTELGHRIAEQGVTLVRNRKHLLPVDLNKLKHPIALAPIGPFLEHFQKTPHATTQTLPMVPNRTERRRIAQDVINAANDADMLFIAVINRYHVDIAQQILKALTHVPTVVVSMASPYYLQLLPQIESYLCTYSYLDFAQQAAWDALLGNIDTRGYLPVTIPEVSPYGTHLPLFASGTVSTSER